MMQSENMEYGPLVFLDLPFKFDDPNTVFCTAGAVMKNEEDELHA